MSQEVSHYGVHWAPGRIAFLHQQRGGMNAIGLKESSPFMVRTKRRWLCNHLIALNAINPARTHLVAFENLVGKNSLVRFMLPLPKDNGPPGVGLFYTKSMDSDLLQFAMLLKMSSPVKMPIFFAKLTTPKVILDELEMTNVQPLVLAGVMPEHTDMVRNLISAAAVLPRKLLVVSHPDVPIRLPVLNGEHLFNQDEVDLTGLPWETLGATVLRAYMRNEWEGIWFTREPIPANEAKQKYGG